MVRKVIILAAGIGSRAYPLTKDIPKCLLKIGKVFLLKKIIDTILEIDKSIKIDVVVGYKAKKVEESLKNYGVTFIRNPFYKLTNSIVSLWFALLNRRELAECVIVNGDICFEKKVLEEVLKFNSNCVVCDSSKKCTDADYKVVVKNEFVVNMGKHILSDKYFAEYAGIIKLDFLSVHRLFQTIECMLELEEYDTWYETAVVYCIKRKALILPYKDIKGKRWIEIDTAADLKKAKKCCK